MHGKILQDVTKKYFSYFQMKTSVVGTKKNSSFEHQKRMLKIMGKNIFTILCRFFFLSNRVKP